MDPAAPPAPPLAALEPAFASLASAMADLEANVMHPQLMHESLGRFAACFASCLYGLKMNALCVGFPELGSGARRPRRVRWVKRGRR
jgi:DASH complex subunit DAM1